MSKPEIRRRYANGLDALMWGTDYPHPEGTWPNTVDPALHRLPRGPGRGDPAAARAQRRALLRPRPRRPRPRSPPTSGRRRRSSTRTSTAARRPTPSARPASGSTTTASSGRAERGRRARRPRRCELDGAVAVVTGGAGGIGRGIVGALLRRGATVVIADVEAGADRVPPSTTSRPLGTVSGHRVDITDEDAVADLADARLRRPRPRSTCCSTTPASPPAAAASRGSRSRTTGAGASASTCSARRSAPRRSCPG